MTKKFWQSPSIALLAVAALACGTAAYAQAPKTPATPEATEQAVLLGQFGDWGAYTALPGGKKVCFALAKPAKAETEPAGRKRDPSYAFLSTRPAENVRNEVSMIV